MAQRLMLAQRHHAAGQLAEAEALYRAILAEAPRHPHALHLMGVLAYQAGRHHEAQTLIEQALAVHGPHPIFYSNLAAVCLELDQLDATIAHCRTALAIQPNLPDAYNNLGAALMRQERYDEAAAAFVQALRLNPGQIDARCNLGTLLQRQGKLAEALACLEQAIRQAPGHARAHNDLAGVLLSCDRPEQAAAAAREAIRLRPTFAEAHRGLGMALRELDQLDDALRALREALRLNPRCAAAHHTLGCVLEYQGDFDGARAEFLEALRLEPNHAYALASLSSLTAAGFERLADADIDRLRQLVMRHDLPRDDLVRLHFALARLLDKAGAYDEAFAHYREGNELRRESLNRRGVTFDPAEHRRLVDRLIAVFTPEHFARVRGFGVDSDLPIFVIGMMRSGTTLAEQILASHPLVHGAGELRAVSQITVALTERGGGTDTYPELLARLDAATVRAVAEEHLLRLRQLGGAAPRVVDKMPSNFLHLGLIATLFPRARIVHCRRDAIDTCLSCYAQNFVSPFPFKHDLGQLGFYYREYQRLMIHWTQVLPIFELRYEELTAAPEQVSRELLAYCGLDWDDRCLRFHETGRPVRTASMLQVRQPMYRSAVGRWKHYEKHLGPLIEALAS
jgi:tetratricopeptide (TPR) repeat protein